MSTLRLHSSLVLAATAQPAVIFMRPPACAQKHTEHAPPLAFVLAKRLGQKLCNVIVGLGLILLLSVAYDTMIGDGPLPTIQAIKPYQQPETLYLSQPLKLDSDAITHDLSSSLTLLGSVSPEIRVWVDTMATKGHIRFQAPTESLSLYGKYSGTQILAAYRPLNDNLYIGPGFWALSDAEKAAILAHEYRHARQNWGKRIRIQLLQILTQGRFRYASQLEAEAFAYEAQVKKALK